MLKYIKCFLLLILIAFFSSNTQNNKDYTIKKNPYLDLYKSSAATSPNTLKIRLTWDRGQGQSGDPDHMIDVDLNIYNNKNEHCYFDNMNISNGYLDIDNTWGFGPEYFTGTNLNPGDIFTVKVNLFKYGSSVNPSVPISCELQIALNDSIKYLYTTLTGTTNWQTVTTVVIPNEVPIKPPDSPGNLTAKDITSNSLTLSWKDNSNNEDGFRIYQKGDGESDFSRIASTSINKNTYSAANLKPDTKYSFKVNAYNEVGSSGYSNTINIRTKVPENLEINGGIKSGRYRALLLLRSNGIFDNDADVFYYAGFEIILEPGFDTGEGNNFEAEIINYEPPLYAPGNLTAEALSDKTIKLQWIDNTNNEDAFSIYRKTSDSEYKYLGMTKWNMQEYLDNKCVHDTSYQYQIRAENIYMDEEGDFYVGLSDFSNEAEALTFSPLPTIPNGFKAVTISNSQINLEWEDSENETGYEIWRKKENEIQFSLLTTLPTDQISYEDINLEQNIKYDYKILSYHLTSKSGFSEIVSAVTSNPITVTSPNENAIWKLGQKVNIIWEKHEEVNDVRIELFKGNQFVKLLNKDINGTTIDYRINTGLLPSSDYRIKITDNNYESIHDYSDYFTISGNDYNLPIINPDETSYWEPGYSQVITWNTNYIPADDLTKSANIILYNNSSRTEYELGTTLLENSGMMCMISSDQNDGNEYQIFIEVEEGKHSYSDIFRIGPPVIEIIYPDKTTEWTQDKDQTIEFFKSHSVESVLIELYKDEELVKTIAENTENENQFIYTMENDLKKGKDYRIKITDTSRPEIFVFSDEFIIKPPIPNFASIKADLTLPDDNRNHWIPNIPGDPLSEITVNIIGKTAQNTDVIMTELFNNIKILPPVDPYWAVNDAGQCNINRNKGTCDYGFYAVHENVSYRLATFYKDGNETDNKFKIRYNQLYFYNDSSNAETYGTAKEDEGFCLKTDVNTGNLYFRNNSLDQTCTSFKIAVIDNSGTIRPGDDMQLRFALTDYETYVDMVDDNDFMAVYDKKMLWRANLYIDEGENDWNILNPWNRPDNEWNKTYNGTARLDLDEDETDISVLDDGDGQQVVTIHPFTYYNFYGNNNENDAVAYAHGCHDNPFEFNSEMLEQQLILNYYIHNKINDVHGDYSNYGDNWQITTAPDSLFNNYIWPLYTGTGNPTDNQIDNSFETIDGEASDCFPYLPGYSTRNNDPNDIYWVNAISAGVDCIGFVQMSAGYDNNLYEWADINWRHYPGDDDRSHWNNGNRTFPRTVDNESWEVVRASDVNAATSIINDGEKIIPGDIIYYPSTGTGQHIMMVLDVEYRDNSRTTTPDRIRIIESNYGYDLNNIRFGKVINIRDLNHYHVDEERDWIIVRLKTN